MGEGTGEGENIKFAPLQNPLPQGERKKGKTMFDKLKQLKQLKDLHDTLSKEKAELEKDGVKVVINGKMEIESIQLNPALEKEKQEKILKDLINEAVKKIQMSMAQKMSGMKGLGF